MVSEDRQPLLAVQNLSVAYGSLPALRDVSLELGHGEVVALIGPNGAGKTTMLRAIAGELRPTAGAVLLDGEPLRGSTFRRARRGVAYVPEGHRVIASLTVAQQLVVSASAAGLRVRSAAFSERVEHLHELFPALKDRADVAAGQLSGGEQQMLAIASALMLEPRVLLIDELSLGLAPQAVDRLLAAVATLPARGTAVLLVEQFADRALGISDRGYLLSEGQVFAHAASAELAASGVIEAVFLGESLPVAATDLEGGR